MLSLGLLVDLGAITVMNDRQVFTALGIRLVRGAIVERQPGAGTQWLLSSQPTGDAR